LALFSLAAQLLFTVSVSPIVMNTEEHDDLWRLLGQAKQPAVSPFFSRNILRDIRAMRQARPGFLGWLRDHWKAPVFATCAIVLVIGGLLREHRSHETTEERQLLALAETVSQSPDYSVIGHLDELLETDENSVWLEPN
jgi:hypothetical protein